MKNNLLVLICAFVLCTVLTLGLWPFHSPRNEVTWLENRNGLRFGSYGTVLSSGSFRLRSLQNNPEASLEIWLQPKGIWDSGTFVAFYRSRNLFQFSLRQSQIDLSVRTADQVEHHLAKTATLDVDDVFRKPRPVLITVTVGAL